LGQKPDKHDAPGRNRLAFELAHEHYR
jgi:hypothetical protein